MADPGGGGGTGADHTHPWNVDDVTRSMSKGGGVCDCECLHPRPSGNPVSAPDTDLVNLYSAEMLQGRT